MTDPQYWGPVFVEEKRQLQLAEQEKPSKKGLQIGIGLNLDSDDESAEDERLSDKPMALFGEKEKQDDQSAIKTASASLNQKY